MQEYRLNALMANATSLDLETDLVQPGLVTPPMVLGSMAEVVGNEIKGAILSKDQCRQIFLAILADPNRVLAVFNGSYDINVLIVDFLKRGIDLFPQVFAMYDPTGEIVQGRCDGRVFDAMIAEMLHAIAQGHLGADSRTGKRFVNPETGRQGRYSLETTHEQVTGNANAKANDRFRKSYHMFHDVPISELPFEARTYPIDDAVNTLWDVLAQAGHMPSMWTHQFREPPPGVRGLVCTRCHLGIEGAPQFCTALLRRRNTHEISRACYFAYAASLGSVWGFKIDHAAVNALEKKILDKREAEVQPFLDAGIIRPDGTENQGVLKKLVAQAYGAKLFCTVCQGTGKVPSQKSKNKNAKVNCEACDGTTLQLPPEVPRSPSGQVAKGADTLQESGDELLMSYNDQEGDKILSTYIPLMRRARACNHCGEPGSGKRKHKHDCPVAVDPNLEADVGYREVPLLPYINSIVETGRCAVEDGLHGLPRSGGVRECFMARPPQYEVVEVPDDYVLQQGEELVR